MIAFPATGFGGGGFGDGGVGAGVAFTVTPALPVAAIVSPF